jgi:hypothetical protein
MLKKIHSDTLQYRSNSKCTLSWSEKLSYFMMTLCWPDSHEMMDVSRRLYCRNLASHACLRVS